MRKANPINAAFVLLTALIGDSAVLAHEDLIMIHSHNAYGGHIAAPADGGVHDCCRSGCYSDGPSRNHRGCMEWSPSSRDQHSRSQLQPESAQTTVKGEGVVGAAWRCVSGQGAGLDNERFTAGHGRRSVQRTSGRRLVQLCQPLAAPCSRPVRPVAGIRRACACGLKRGRL